MIKLKQLLFKNTAPGIFVPRRMEDRLERMIKDYIRNGSKGNLNLSYMELTVLPAILKNVDIEGNFWCIFNKLTSLVGAPKDVGGKFDCSNNKLTSLQGAPKTVGGNFFCNNNNLTSLQGAPKTVGGHFHCGFNNLTSLDGAPEYVGGEFYIINNPGKFLTKQIKAVCDVQGAIFVGGYDKA